MHEDLEEILKKKVEEGAAEYAEEQKRQREHEALEARRNERLNPALEVIASELQPIAEMLKRNGYKDASVVTPPPSNRWQGRALRVKLNDDSRTPTLRYYVQKGRIYAKTIVTEMGDLAESTGGKFNWVIHDEPVDQLLPDESIRTLVSNHIRRFITELPPPTGKV